MKFTNEKLNSKLAKREILTSKFIKDESLSKKEINDYNKALKEAKRLAKIDALKLDKCLISFNGQTINFKPSLTTVNSNEVIVWKSLDKNACYVASEKDGLVNVEAVPACSTKSQYYSLRLKQISSNKKLVNELIEQVFKGMEWNAFIERVKGYKNIRTINTPSYLQ